MTSPGRIIYTGTFRFPEGDAAAARVLGIGRALRQAGYEVEYAGWEAPERPEDLGEDGCYRYQGFRYRSSLPAQPGGRGAWARVRRFAEMGIATVASIAAAPIEGVRAIIAYHGTSRFLLQLDALCRRRGIPLIVDCTEWYDARHLPGGRLGPVALDNALRMRWVNRRVGNVLAISSFLRGYYAARGCRTIQVPPLVDLGEPKWPAELAPASDDGTLRIVYAGVPAKKDLLRNAVVGLFHLRSEGARIELHLLGPSRADVARCLASDAGLLDRLGGAVVLHGRVAQPAVPALLARADFSVLLRPRARFAQAGFSTKLVESLAAGVPVLANVTGDIAEVVRDGDEGILLEDSSPAAFCAGARRALALPASERGRMRRAARERARRSFDYRNYVDVLRDFVEGSTPRP